ncbi:MAG TPA: ATP synthase subunit C [Candidatus Anaerotruncus excrementipullorum]|uniref:ATP synthase subunit C n=1 Tax=Candidatus Anaerotruncus excrementipullorum TaxID=2838465 RepID=A0A9D1WSG5_9FIRM|nr:ATP synthase subunit C [Candidatus Anaerotruncus excrementipullorum]
MLYLIPAAALAAALVLLRPLFGSPKAPHARRRLLANGGVFAVSALLLVALSVGAAAAEPAAAGEAAAAAATAAASGSGLGQGLGYLAAALATGMSCLGAGIAIASTAPAAIGAFSEDPKAFGKALIFVVLGEGVALYGLLISILLINSL